MEAILLAMKYARFDKKNSCNSKAIYLAILCAVVGLIVFLDGLSKKNIANDTYSSLVSNNCTEPNSCGYLNVSDLCQVGFCNWYGDNLNSDSWMAIGLIGGFMTTLGGCALKKCFNEPTVSSLKDFKVESEFAAELIQKNRLLPLLNQLATKLGREAFLMTTPLSGVYEFSGRVTDGIASIGRKSAALKAAINDKDNKKVCHRVFAKGFATLFEPKNLTQNATGSTGSKLRNLPTDAAPLMSLFLTNKDLVKACITTTQSYREATKALTEVCQEELAQYRI